MAVALCIICLGSITLVALAIYQDRINLSFLNMLFTINNGLIQEQITSVNSFLSDISSNQQKELLFKKEATSTLIELHIEISGIFNLTFTNIRILKQFLFFFAPFSPIIAFFVAENSILSNWFTDFSNFYDEYQNVEQIPGVFEKAVFSTK